MAPGRRAALHQDRQPATELGKFGGIAYKEHGAVVATPNRRTIKSDYVELPDFDAVHASVPEPLAAGVIETVRGCTENCSYCEVIQQFWAIVWFGGKSSGNVWNNSNASRPMDLSSPLPRMAGLLSL